MVNLTPESFKGKKLWIGIPMYGGKIFGACTYSLLKFQQIAIMFGLEVHYDFLFSESLIPRARNRIIFNFMQQKAFTHMMFIDADIVFDPKDILKLLWYDHDICVGAYPCKSLYLDKILKLKELGHPNPEPASYHYAINIDPEAKQQKIPNCIEIKYGATGFMMIKKNVIERLMVKFPDLYYINDVPDGQHGEIAKHKIFCFFDSIICPKSQRYLSEDYYFCELWKKIGGKIHCDLTINLTHIGQYGFRGSIINKLNGKTIVKKNLTEKINKLKNSSPEKSTLPSTESSTESSTEKTEVIDELLNEINEIKDI